MAKKVEVETENTEIESENNEELEVAQEQVETKVAKKVAKAVKEGASKKQAVNVIGDITPPQDPEDKEDVKEYLKRVESKLDQLLARGTEEESDELEEDEENVGPENLPKVPWYDRPLL